MPISRKIWGGFVFGLGILWLIGGVFGYFEGHLVALIFIFCGAVLVRMGRNLLRGNSAPK